MQREFRNTRIDEAITAVVAAADAVAPATTAPGSPPTRAGLWAHRFRAPLKTPAWEVAPGELVFHSSRGMKNELP